MQGHDGGQPGTHGRHLHVELVQLETHHGVDVLAAVVERHSLLRPAGDNLDLAAVWAQCCKELRVGGVEREMETRK